MEINSLVNKEVSIFSGSGSNDCLHIAFAVDDKFIKPTGIAITSIVYNNPGQCFHFHIFTSSLCDNNVDKIKKLNLGNSSLTIHFFDENLFSRYQTLNNLPHSMYYRLVIPGILNGKARRVLYLDADVVCNGSIDELTHKNIEDYVIAAVLDSFVISNDDDYLSGLGLDINGNYFNSGVMLINVDKWNSENVLSEFNKIIFSRKYSFPDQDVLNIILQHKVIMLDGKFNTFSWDCEHYNIASIIHFAGENKPWGTVVNKSDLYMKYYELSPWKGEALRMPENYKECKKYAVKLWGNGDYPHSVFWFFRYLFKKTLPCYFSKK